MLLNSVGFIDSRHLFIQWLDLSPVFVDAWTREAKRQMKQSEEERETEER